MGLRNASVRLPNVVVMAPALTETAQPRNFKLNPNSDLAGFSVPTKKLRSLKDIVPLSLRDAKPDVCDPVYPDGMNGHSPSKITYSINGITKSLKNEFVPLDKFNPCSGSNEPAGSRDTGNKIVNSYTGDCDVTQVEGFVMSNSGNSMGDSSENMGVQRLNNQDLTGLTDPEVVSPNREKLSQAGDMMDQLLKNLVDKPEEIFGSTELGQNVDDILQVFITGNSAPDLPALGPTPSDGESMFPIPSNDIDGSLTSLERELFNGEDMMNMCVDDGLVIMNKETVIKDRLEEARKKQFQLKRKCEFLGRRLKKIQTRTLGRHVCDEITGMLEYTNNMYEAVTRANKNGEVGSEVRCDVKGVSLSTLSLLMRQMEHSAAQQASYLAKSNTKSKYFGAGSSSANTSNGMRLPGTIIPSFPDEVKEEAVLVTGELQAQLSMLQEEVDSDLTESSSGCDSTDEFVPYNSPLPYPSSTAAVLQPPPQIPINKRALWRYSVERCLLAGRWAWLQARISDLDYRIRQTSELRRQLRLTKGNVRLRAPITPPTPTASTHPAGTVPVTPSAPAELAGCARTLSVADGLRRRRIIRAEGLHLRSKRAGRATSVRCGCRGPPPCLLCTGRPDPTTPTDPTQNLPVSSRVGLLDAAFHPNISFPSEVSESIHYAAVMKCSDWQSRAWRARGVTVGRVPSVGSSPIISVGAAREAVSTLDDVRRPNRTSSTPPDDITPLTPQSSSATSSSSSIRKKNPRGRRRRPFDGFKVIKPRKISVGVDDVGRPTPSVTPLNAVPSTSSGAPAATAVLTAPSEQDSVFNGGNDKYASPVPSPTPSKDQFRRKRENSYDIDNIVIPYCMAASTRPERLLYKEILTPKWRLVKDEKSESVTGKNGAVRRPSHELEGEEDCSEETVTARHDRCEIEERKKFLSYTRINRPGGRGQRRTDSRADSRADSTGPSTPLCMGEPMSPRESGNSMDSGEGASKSPRASPPPPFTTEAMTGQPLGTSTRRRTVSGSSVPAAPFSSLNPRSPPPPPPPNLQSEDCYYEPRLFPLPDEVFEKMLQEQRESQEYPPEEERPFRYSSEYGVLLDSSEDEA